MSENQIVSLIFVIFGIIWIYKGATMLYQSIQYEQQTIWYKRFKLTRGAYWLLLGLGVIIVEGTSFARVPIPFGDIGWYIMLGMAILMFLFGGLSLRYKPRT